jgi:hypothetical protein
LDLPKTENNYMQKIALDHIETEDDAIRILAEVVPNLLENTLRAGRALRTVQEKKLYRASFKTFEAWSSTHFGLSKTHSYRLIDYANVTDSLLVESTEEKTSPIGDKSVRQLTDAPPLTESQARALKPVPEEKRAEVLEHAAASGPVTAAKITESAQVVLNPRNSAESEKPLSRDATGWLVPPSVAPLFHRQGNVRDILQKVSAIRGVVRRVMEADNDPLFRECQLQDMLHACDQLHQQLKLALPYAVCPYCHGVNSKSCQPCKGRGAVSEFRWQHCVPEEIKALRKKAIADEK